MTGGPPGLVVRATGVDLAKPDVSVIVPCFNQARFLVDAVESVRSQTMRNWECVIIDDGSTDDTSTVARSLAASDPRLVVLNQPNRGLSGARNAGLSQARGRYVQFLDADDLITPSKLEAQLSALSGSAGLALSYSDYRYCPQNDVTATASRDNFAPPRFVTSKPLWDIASRWETEFSIPAHCFLFDARFFTERGISFDESLPNHEDWDCWMRVFALEPLVTHVPGPLAIYRLHDEAMTKDRSAMALGFEAAIQKQIRNFSDDPEMRARLLRKQVEMRRVYAGSRPSFPRRALRAVRAALIRRVGHAL